MSGLGRRELLQVAAATAALGVANRGLAQGRGRMSLLWDACQIPDFRKLADDTHARLCARVFNQVAQDKALPADWLDGQIAALDRVARAVVAELLPAARSRAVDLGFERIEPVAVRVDATAVRRQS